MVTELIEAVRENKKPRLDRAYEKLIFHIDFWERRSMEYHKLRDLLREMIKWKLQSPAIKF